MLNRAEAAPSSATPNQNHSAPGDRIQSRPPAAVLAFPVRNSNFARACVASLDLTPGCRITANAIADFAAVHSRPQKYRHIESGDCAAYPAMAAIRRKRPGRRKVCPRTIQNHIAEMLAAADAAAGGVERRRTRRTNTYVFTLPEQPQKQPEIRAEIADNCYPLCYPECGPIEPRREEDQEQVQVQKNRARATTTTTATTAVRTDADSTGRDPGPSCAPETPPPARRSPVKATPATPAQLDYLALLADGVGIDRPDPSTLTTRSADHLIRDLKPRYARREERRRHGDRRCKSVPRAVKAQIERTDRSAPIHGCPASARRARIDVLEVTLEQWRSRTDPATVQEWERELAELAAAAITEEDRHREGLRPPGSCAAGSPPATTCNDGRRGRAAKVLAALEQRIRQAAAWVMTGGAVSGPPPG